jgi:hypothetical protein
MADILDRVEGDAALVELEAWGRAAVAALAASDPQAEVAERDRRRWEQANEYGLDLLAFRDRQR